MYKRPLRGWEVEGEEEEERRIEREETGGKEGSRPRGGTIISS